jgi:hypothetical protein
LVNPNPKPAPPQGGCSVGLNLNIFCPVAERWQCRADSSSTCDRSPPSRCVSHACIAFDAELTTEKKFVFDAVMLKGVFDSANRGSLYDIGTVAPAPATQPRVPAAPAPPAAGSGQQSVPAQLGSAPGGTAPRSTTGTEGGVRQPTVGAPPAPSREGVPPS